MCIYVDALVTHVLVQCKARYERNNGEGIRSREIRDVVVQAGRSNVLVCE